MKKGMTGGLFVVLFWAGVASGATHYVSTNGLHIYPYINMLNAATNLQDAVNAAAPTGRVEVLDEWFLMTHTLEITNGISLYGRADTRTWLWFDTLTGLFVDHRDAVVASVGLFGVEHDSPLVQFRGATVSNCYFADCRGPFGGAFMGSNVWVVDSFFYTNRAQSGSYPISMGGALYLEGQSNRIERCVFAGNDGDQNGGAIFVDGAAQIIDCRFWGNKAKYGGAVFGGSLYNCLLVGNEADYGGGAFYSQVSHSTLVSNTASIAGGGVYGCTSRNSIIYWNTFSAVTNANYANYIVWHGDYCCTDPAPFGTACITNDPLFVAGDPEFHLMSNSPCINAGNNAYDRQPYDLGGEPRKQGAATDIGCWEYPEPAVYFSLTNGLNGSCSPLGVVTSYIGASIECRAFPDEGYRVDEWRVDGALEQEGGLLFVYEPIHTSHAAYVTFEPRPSADLYVATNGRVSGDGSFTNPYLTIQAGIDGAMPGDRVMVMDGVYRGAGNTDLDFAGKSMTLMSLHEKPFAVIDCEHTHTAFKFHSGETTGTVVNGFGIRYAPTSAVQMVSNASPVFKNCSFEENMGAVCSENSAPTFNECIFSKNRAANGGAIYACASSFLVVSNCTFDGNEAGLITKITSMEIPIPESSLFIVSNVIRQGRAGAVALYDSQAEINGSVFSNNVCGLQGGAVFASNSSLHVSHSVFDNNMAEGSESNHHYYLDLSGPVQVHLFWHGASAGGAVASWGSTVTVLQCRFHANYAPLQGGAVYAGGQSALHVEQSRFVSNMVYGHAVSNVILWAYTPDIEWRQEYRGGKALQGGGAAVFFDRSDGSFDRCQFKNHRLYDGAGALRSLSSKLLLTHCVWSENPADRSISISITSNEYEGIVVASSTTVRASSGAAITANDSTVRVVHCTLAENGAPYGSNTVYLTNSSLVLADSVFADRSWETVGHSTVTADTSRLPLPLAGAGNFTNDSRLVWNWRLSSNSPCIDAASGTGPAVDYDGEARWDHPAHANVYSIADIGADEYVDRDGDGAPEAWEVEAYGSSNAVYAGSDRDGDELSDADEYHRQTDADDPDTDGDAMTDGWEVRGGLNPLEDDAGEDGDSDTFDNYAEFVAQTDPGDGSNYFCIGRYALMTNGPGLCWTGEIGRVYRVYEDDGAGGWTSVCEASGSGGVTCYTNAEASARLLFLTVEME